MPQAPDALMVAFLSGRTERTIAAWDVRSKLQREPKHCTWCNRVVPKYRRSWCGEECADEWFIRTRPESARNAVEKRDRGVCHICKADTDRISRLISNLAKAARTQAFQGTWDNDYKTIPWPGWERPS